MVCGTYNLIFNLIISDLTDRELCVYTHIGKQERIPVGCVPSAVVAVRWEGGGTCPEGVPAGGVYLFGGVYLPGGVPAQGQGGVYLLGGYPPGGVPAQGGVPAWGDVSA